MQCFSKFLNNFLNWRNIKCYNLNKIDNTPLYKPKLKYNKENFLVISIVLAQNH